MTMKPLILALLTLQLSLAAMASERTCKGDCVIDPRADEIRAMMEAMGYQFRTADLRPSDRNPHDTEGTYRNCLAGECGGGFHSQRINIIGGKDDRRLLTSHEEYMASGVGMVVCSNPNINGGKTSAASGSLAGNRRTMITTAHSFWHEKSAAKYDFAKDCAFRLYNLDGSIKFETGFVRAKMGDFAIFKAPAGELRFQSWFDDWAVLRLAQEAPSDVWAYGVVQFGTNYINPEREIFTVGFHHDRDLVTHRRYISPDCNAWAPPQILEPGGDLSIRHSCDTNGRASGSPMFYQKSDGTWLITGIHKAGHDPRHSDYGRFNTGLRLDGAFYRALKEME